MRRFYTFLIFSGLLLPVNPAKAVDLRLGVYAGISTYSRDMLPGLSNISQAPSTGLELQLPITEAFELGLLGNYTRKTLKDLDSSFDLKDLGGQLSIRYCFYRPESMELVSYIGGAVSRHTLTLSAEEYPEALDGVSVNGFAGLLGVRLKPAFLPTQIFFEGRYASFELKSRTLGINTLQFGLIWRPRL